MATSLSDIKSELEHKDRKELMQYCLRLTRAKKENKELLGFILFEEYDLPGFIEKVNLETETFFEEINYSNTYFIKKGLRKILRNVNKNIKFAGNKSVEAELLIYFCNCFSRYKIPVNNSRQIKNIYENQSKKISLAIAALHPDLQYDLLKQWEKDFF